MGKRLRWWIVAGLIGLSWSMSGSACAAPLRLAPEIVVESVNCEQWERWRQERHDVWRANVGALIETDRGALHLPPGDVFDAAGAPELWFTIEWKCSPEYGAGIWDAQ